MSARPEPAIQDPFELLPTPQNATQGSPEEAQLLPRMATEGCELLKSMAHEGRLVILYLLSQRERSVTELEATLEMRQPAVSQQLARLRADNLVTTRRDGKMVFYSLDSEKARSVVELMATLYGH